MKIIADTHVHSSACSHAYSSITENIQSAKEAGMRFLAMTEHGPQMPDAPHIWHINNLREVPSFVNGVYLLHGVEVDVLDEEGSLDVEDSILQGLDWVIASMHPPCIDATNSQAHTRAWINIAKNENVDVIGHCGDSRYRFDYEKGIKAFKEYGKIVEINNNSAYIRPGAKKNCVEIANFCKKYEVMVVVNSDAHYCSKIGHFEAALQMLEEIGYPEHLVVNGNLELFANLVKEKSPYPEEYIGAESWL